MQRFAKGIVISAGIIPVYLSPQQDPHYLILRAYSYWDFPKGMQQENETSLEAALRELEEETTLKKVDFAWGTEYRDTDPYSYGKIARYFVGRVDTMDVSLPVNPLLGRPEHQEFRWLGYEQTRSTLAPRVRPMLDWAHKLVKT